MTDVEYQTRQLIREIRKSNEYNQFRRLAAKLDRDPELKEEVDSYRRKRFQLQNAEDGEDQLLQMEKEYEDVLSKSVVRDFLISEQKLMYMIQNTVLAITDAVGLDLEL